MKRSLILLTAAGMLSSGFAVGFMARGDTPEPKQQQLLSPEQQRLSLLYERALWLKDEHDAAWQYLQDHPVTDINQADENFKNQSAYMCDLRPEWQQVADSYKRLAARLNDRAGLPKQVEYPPTPYCD